MRNARAVFGALILMTSGFGAAATAASAPLSSTPVPFVTVAQGPRSAIAAPTQTVIRDAVAWAALWRRHTGNPTASPPAVDFRTSMVIAIFAGRTPASTAVAVRRILAEDTGLEVQYTQGERRPLPPGEQEMDATPFHMVRLSRVERSVRFALVKTPPVLGPGPSS